jgi:hypothetical protein
LFEAVLYLGKGCFEWDAARLKNELQKRRKRDKMEEDDESLPRAGAGFARCDSAAYLAPDPGMTGAARLTKRGGRGKE